MPKHEEQARKVEELWLKGEIPIHFASDHLDVPVSLLLLGLPRAHSHPQDGRQRAIIPVASGIRQPASLQPDWKVAFDITSLILLFRLGILKEALSIFRQAVIPPDTMLVLLNDRKKVRFQQPSLVEAAREVRRMIDLDRLRIADDLAEPQKELAEEVGYDLAQLLETARRKGGYVIRPRPIYKLKSFLTDVAQTGDYDDLIFSVLEFEDLLNKRGEVDRDTHNRASLYLHAQDRGSAHRDGQEKLDGPVYLDDLALSYIHQAGLLAVLQNSTLDFQIHPSVQKERFALISNAREREALAKSIDELRTILRDAITAEQLGFLRWH
ncbi:MAG TPA: hypothetical protein VJQ25_02350, partial [Nitrospira sp.]|nr:hypothetical protein [Nitrospira sp.]